METRHLFIFFFLIVLVIPSCKKNNVNVSSTPCLNLISPINGTVTSRQPTLKWDICSSTAGSTVYLFYYYHGAYIFDTVQTQASQLTWNSTLPYGTLCHWRVKNGNLLSDTNTFTTEYPDSLYVGAYYVTAGYHSYQAPNIVYDTVYGQTTVYISQVSPGELLLTDDSIGHTHFPFYYQGNDSLYGDDIGGQDYNYYLRFPNAGTTINASAGSESAGGTWGKYWRGTKVH